jgi:hypothetical protein
MTEPTGAGPAAGQQFSPGEGQAPPPGQELSPGGGMAVRSQQPYPQEGVPADGPAQEGYPGGTEEEEAIRLLSAQELETMISRWEEIQAEFVDEPARAVRDADALVGELIERLTERIASERETLGARWSGGASVSTEELRQGLRRYRSFFERLLAA